MRILITTVTAGAGHLQAAAAIKEAWPIVSPGDEVTQVDVLDHVPKLYRKVYVDGYVKLIEKAPELWGYLFKKTDNHRLLAKVGKWRGEMARHTYRTFAKLLREHRPDVVISTHFMPVEILAGIQSRHHDFKPFHACVVTDFEAHALWLEHRVNLYCVAAEETRRSLVARGMEADRVVATGIPIAQRFSQPIDSKAVRRKYGWRDDLPVLLVLGGGFGMGPVAEVLNGLDQVSGDFQTVVVAGRNAELREKLSAVDRRHPTDVLGFVTNMHELMSVASLIISKPGGLTTSEALALGKPLFILNPIPGQEAANSDYLLERGAAVKVNRVDDVAAKVEGLLAGNRLSELGKAAAKLGRPAAALDVCRAVLAKVK
ncbi:glycosyltransferase [bacterium]|nr:glycosyltransferase [bacterium]